MEQSGPFHGRLHHNNECVGRESIFANGPLSVGVTVDPLGSKTNSNCPKYLSIDPGDVEEEIE